MIKRGGFVNGSFFVAWMRNDSNEKTLGQDKHEEEKRDVASMKKTPCAGGTKNERNESSAAYGVDEGTLPFPILGFPASAETCRRHPLQSQRPREIAHALCHWHPGYRNPSGHRRQKKLLPTGRIIGEAPLQFHQRARIIFDHS